MNNTQNQLQSLNSLSGVHEISKNDSAAVLGGRAYVYDINPQNHKYRPRDNFLGSARIGFPRLSQRANDDISFITVTQGKWRFYEHSNYRGRSLILTSGTYDLKKFYKNWDQRISSFKRVE